MDNYSIKSYAGQKLAACADQLRMQNDSLSVEQAMVEACRQNPGLYHARRYGELENEFRKYDTFAPAPQDVEQIRLDAVERAIALLAADEDLIARLANQIFETARDKLALKLIQAGGVSQAEAISRASTEVFRELPEGFREAMRGRLDLDNWEVAAMLSMNIADQIQHLNDVRTRKRKEAIDAKGVTFSKDPIVRRAVEIARARGIQPDSPFYDAEIRGALMDAKRGFSD
jgi:hypothetical protein